MRYMARVLMVASVAVVWLLVVALPPAWADVDRILGVDSADGIPQAMLPEDAAALVGVGVSGWPSVNVPDGVTWANSLATAFKVGKDTSNYWALYHDVTDGLQFVGVCAGVVNDCNYTRKLNSGKFFSIKNSAGTEILTVTESTGAITNANINAEGSGNTLTIKDHMWRPFGACQNGVASSIWDYGTSNAPTPACKGSATTKGVLQFPDGSTDLSTTIIEYLNGDWTGAIEGYLLWESASTSTNNVLWGIAIACAGPGESSDPAFTDDDFPVDANNATANTYNVTASNTVATTGTCTAGKLMHIRVKRRLSQAGDTLAATAEGVGLYLLRRQAQ